MSNPKSLRRICEQVEFWFLGAQRVLPWRENRTPYRVWVSEIMLQQTQVSKVIDYYNRFMARFQTISELALATEDEVLSQWTGLGYYSRCRNLHKAAKIVMSDFGGEFPKAFEAIASLPGIGSYTAGAIYSFAFNEIAPVVDGNIARVLSRVYSDSTPIDSPRGKAHFESLSLTLAKTAGQPALLHEGLMEIGATVCFPRTPQCASCPLTDCCKAHRQHNASAFPVKGKKSAKKELHGVFAILGDADHIWLERNDNARLLNKLYAPPHLFIEQPSDMFTGLERLSQEIGFQMPNAPFESFTVVRQLTHRIFHLHGFKIKASPQDFPKGNWKTRGELSEIGISSAIMALISKAQLLAFAVFLAVGCTHNQANLKTASWANARELQKRPSPLSLPATNAMPDAIVKAANSAVGKRQVSHENRYFRRDCSGSLRGIFEVAGFSLRAAKSKKRQSDTKTLYDFVEQNGRITKSNPSPGDLVFFHNTYDVNHDGRMNDDFSHVGIVTQILEDGTVTYVHYSQGKIIRSTMLDELRRGSRKSKGKTGIDLFASYGKLDFGT